MYSAWAESHSTARRPPRRPGRTVGGPDEDGNTFTDVVVNHMIFLAPVPSMARYAVADTELLGTYVDMTSLPYPSDGLPIEFERIGA